MFSNKILTVRFLIVLHNRANRYQQLAHSNPIRTNIFRINWINQKIMVLDSLAQLEWKINRHHNMFHSASRLKTIKIYLSHNNLEEHLVFSTNKQQVKGKRKIYSNKLIDVHKILPVLILLIFIFLYPIKESIIWL